MSAIRLQLRQTHELLPQRGHVAGGRRAVLRRQAEEAGENFFHTFDELHDARPADRDHQRPPPKAIPLLPERLCSRFEWGLVTEVQPPGYDTAGHSAGQDP